MRIFAGFFDNIYPFLVIIFFVISIISSILKKRAQEQARFSVQDGEDDYEEEQEVHNYDKKSENIRFAEQKHYYKSELGKKHLKEKERKLHKNINAEMVSEKKEEAVYIQQSDVHQKQSAIEKISNLPFLQRSFVMSEVLGKPKGLDD